MISTSILATYVTVVLGLMVIPGPATLLTLARSITGGRRVGLATGFGIATGDFIHIPGNHEYFFSYDAWIRGLDVLVARVARSKARILKIAR